MTTVASGFKYHHFNMRKTAHSFYPNSSNNSLFQQCRLALATKE